MSAAVEEGANYSEYKVGPNTVPVAGGGSENRESFSILLPKVEHAIFRNLRQLGQAFY